MRHFQNPAFFYDRYEAVLPEGGSEGLKLMVEPQDVRAFDKDVGLGSPVFYSFNAETDDYRCGIHQYGQIFSIFFVSFRHFELNRNTGHIYIKSDIPEEEFLQPVTLVIKATQFDNPGAEFTTFSKNRV